MRGKAAVLWVCCCLLLLPLLGWGAIPEPNVDIAAQEAGFIVNTPHYKARIGDDGNLHSLLISGVEFLDDRITGSAGASYFVDKPIPVPKPTREGRTITATDGTYTIKYEFEEGYFTLTLQHTSQNGAAYVAICSPQVSVVQALNLGGAAATPAEYNWPDVRLSTPSGAFLDLIGGTRVWGRGLGRQVWERSNIAPKREYTLIFIPGQGQPVSLDPLQLTVMAAKYTHPDQLFTPEEPVELRVTFANNANQAIATDMALHVESSLGKTLMDGRKPFSCDPHQTATVLWSIIPAVPDPPVAPDFYTITATIELGGRVKRLTSTFGYAAAQINPVTPKPADYADYWNRVKAEARAAEVSLKTLEDPARSTNTVKVYRIGMEVQGMTSFGWLAVPKFPGRYPGLLLLPGDRVRYLGPNAALADCGLVVMTIEPTGQPVDGQLKPLIKLASANLDNPATFGLRAVVIRYLQAITALSTGVPEVDPNRIAVTGVGLGGGMALLLAALDERIQAVAPDVPNYCGIEWGIDADDWPYQEVTDFLRANPDKRDAVLNTLRYFDVVNAADAITCPVLISAGMSDTYSRPTCIYAVLNRLPGPRILKLYPGGHEGGGTIHWETKIRWLTQVLGGPSPTPPAPAPAVAPEPAQP